MADITDSAVIRFLNEEVRPLAERLLREDAKHQRVIGIYNNQITGNADFIQASGGEFLLDPQGPRRGVTHLTKDQFVAVITQAIAFDTYMDVAGRRDVLDAAAVRALVLE